LEKPQCESILALFVLPARQTGDKAEALQSAEKSGPRVDPEWMRIRQERDLTNGRCCATRDKGLRLLAQKRERGTASGSPSQVFVVNAVAASAGRCNGAHRKSGVVIGPSYAFQVWSQSSLLSCKHAPFILLCANHLQSPKVLVTGRRLRGRRSL